MSNLPRLRPQMFDASSDVINGAEWNFYENNTTTPKTTYTDRARTNPASNPVVADSRGEIARPFLTPGEAYTVTITAASGGATIYTENDVFALESSDSSTRERLNQGFSSPLDFGAVGDGNADESTEVQQAIDASVGVVDLLGKTFRCDSAITLKSGLTIRNGTFDFSNCTANEYLKGLGTRGTPTNLTGNAAVGAQVFAATSVADMSAGDLIYSDSTTAWSSAGHIGEIHEIDSIASLDVTIVGVIESAHATAATAQIVKLTTVNNIRLEDLTINCSTSASGNGDVIHLEVCKGVVIDNVKINSFKGTGIELRQCVDVTITSCTLDEDGGAAQGIDIAEGSRGIYVEDCTFRRLAIGIRVGDASGEEGVVRWVSLVSNKFYGCLDGIQSLGNTQYGSAEYNTVIGGDGSGFLVGIAAIGNDWVIDHNFIGNYMVSAIQMSTVGTDTVGRALRASNNTIHNCGDASADNNLLLNFANASSAVQSITVSGNTFLGCVGAAIRISQTNGAIGRAIISGNTLEATGSGDDGIVVTTSGSGTWTSGLSISKNHVTVNGGDAIAVDGIDNMTIGDNVLEITGGTGVCIGVQGVVTGVVIADNNIATTTQGTAIEVEETNASGISRVSVTGNVVTGDADLGMKFGGYINGLVISDNNIKCGTVGPGVEVTGDATDSIKDVIFDGNVIDGGTDCFQAANCADIILGTNRLTGFTNLSISTVFGQASGLRVIRQTVLFSDFTDGGGAVGTLVLDDDIPAGAVFARLVIQNHTGFTGDTTAVMTVGDGSDVDRYHTSGTLNIFVSNSSGINAGAPVGTLWHTAAISPTLIVTSTADYTSITAGGFDIELWFYQG